MNFCKYQLVFLRTIVTVCCRLIRETAVMKRRLVTCVPVFKFLIGHVSGDVFVLQFFIHIVGGVAAVSQYVFYFTLTCLLCLLYDFVNCSLSLAAVET